MTQDFSLRTIDATQMRQVNRSAILELVRQSSPIARSEICKQLGLSMPTVIRIVDELMEDGLVKLTGETAGKTGRPRQLLRYNQNGGLVIGIDLGGTSLYGALANIGGEVLGELYSHLQGSSPEENYSVVVQMIQALVERSVQEKQALLGIAIGVPGVTQARSGVVEWAPSLNWRKFSLKERVAKCFQLPVVVENDVNLAVLGELWFGVGRGVRDLVLLSIGTGMGAGIVIDGMLYRGHNSASGEVGYFIPGVEALGHRFEQFGAMEEIISDIGLVKRARTILTTIKPEMDLSSLTAGEISSAARGGDPWANQLVDGTADYLGLVIVNIATLLDPDLVILGGGIASSADLLIPRILSRIEGVIQHIPRLEASTLGARATVMGAISTVLHLTKDYYIVRHL
jgi:glucokinase